MPNPLSEDSPRQTRQPQTTFRLPPVLKGLVWVGVASKIAASQTASRQLELMMDGVSPMPHHVKFEPYSLDDFKTVTYPGGGYDYGQIIDHRLEGVGIRVYPKATDIRSGEFHDNELNGNGVAVDTDYIEIGQFVDSRFEAGERISRTELIVEKGRFSGGALDDGIRCHEKNGIFCGTPVTQTRESNDCIPDPKCFDPYRPQTNHDYASWFRLFPKTTIEQGQSVTTGYAVAGRVFFGNITSDGYSYAGFLGWSNGVYTRHFIGSANFSTHHVVESGLFNSDSFIAGTRLERSDKIEVGHWIKNQLHGENESLTLPSRGQTFHGRFENGQFKQGLHRFTGGTSSEHPIVFPFPFKFEPSVERLPDQTYRFRINGHPIGNTKIPPNTDCAEIIFDQHTPYFDNPISVHQAKRFMARMDTWITNQWDAYRDELPSFAPKGKSIIQSILGHSNFNPYTEWTTLGTELEHRPFQDTRSVLHALSDLYSQRRPINPDHVQKIQSIVRDMFSRNADVLMGLRIMCREDYKLIPHPPETDPIHVLGFLSYLEPRISQVMPHIDCFVRVAIKPTPSLVTFSIFLVNREPAQAVFNATLGQSHSLENTLDILENENVRVAEQSKISGFLFGIPRTAVKNFWGDNEPIYFGPNAFYKVKDTISDQDRNHLARWNGCATQILQTANTPLTWWERFSAYFQ